MNTLSILLTILSFFSLGRASEEEFVSEQALVEGFWAGDFIKLESRLSTAVQIIGNADRQYVAGEPVNIVVNVKNSATKEEFVVDHIQASIRHQKQWAFRLENFTATKYDDAVPAGHEASFSYQFTPHESFQPKKYGITALLYLHDLKGNKFVHPVFNETFTIIDNSNTFDLHTVFMFMVFAGFAFAISFAIQNSFIPTPDANKNKKLLKPKAASKSDKPEDWLVDTNFQPKKKSSKKSKK